MPRSVPRSEPGTRTVERGFFADHPRFFESSKTTASPWRLNLRYEAMIAENRDVLEGARVLDISSHDGRWSFAALQAGAAHVTGVEARPELVDHAVENLEAYGISSERYRFLTGDVFEVLADGELDVDVVLCPGFLYHTFRYPELMKLIKRCDPKHVIFDTEVVRAGGKAMVQLSYEHVAREGNAVADRFSHGEFVVFGRPSVKAVRVLCRAYDFIQDGSSDWAGLLRDNPEATGVNDYRRRERVTLRFRVMAEHERLQHTGKRRKSFTGDATGV